jgi:hypothetical protein
MLLEEALGTSPIAPSPLVKKINNSKIGTTSSGSILVEMTKEQYEALAKIAGPPKAHPHQKSEESKLMSFTDKLAFVKPRIIKLAPKKLDGLKRGVQTMFNFVGGIDDKEIDKIINALKSQGVIKISDANKVAYK